MGEYERQQREKDRILRRIMNGNLRVMGTGFRQAFQWMEFDRAAEIALMARQRGIMRRFVIKTLTDKDAAFTLMAYNQLKQRMLMLNGFGLGDAEMKKVQLIKRLTNQGHNLQVMGVNSIREYLTSERDREEREREE